MNKIELASKINEIWEIEVDKNGLKSELALKLQDLKYDVVKNLSLSGVVVPKDTLCNKNENKLGMCNCCGDNNCHDDFCKG